jgi:MFS family permease
MLQKQKEVNMIEKTRAENLPSQITAESRQRRRAIVSAFLGQTMEWYDFTLYGTATALVFGPLFFSTATPAVALIQSFAAFALGWVARPLGGIVGGHIGDRLGRKKMLVFTFLVMGISTTLVGLLPTYAQVGAVAPVLLIVLRVVQGLSAGAEYGAAALVTTESARPEKRGFSASITQAGISVGVLLSQGVFFLCSALTGSQFLEWGWRVPFLLSLILVGVTVWIRYGVKETPAFEKAEEAREAEGREKLRVPVFVVFRYHRRALIATFFALFGIGLCLTFEATFLLSYASNQLFEPAQAVAMVTVGSAVELVVTPFAGIMSDRFGRRPVMIAGAVLLMVGAFVVFPLLNSHVLFLGFLGFAMMTLFHGIAYGPASAMMSEQFPTEVRYSGMSVAYQLSVTLGAGFGPLIAALLLAAAGGAPNTLLVSLYIVGALALSVVGLLYVREGAGRLQLDSVQNVSIRTS